MRTFRFEGKGLTFIQPWASAIAFAGKDVENRTWRTHYRGPLAIHAGQKLDLEQLHELRRTVRGGEKRPLMDLINGGRRRHGLAAQEKPETGHILAIAMVVGCVEKSTSLWHDRGYWGWAIAGVVPIEPLPWIGGQSIWDCRFKYSLLSD